MDPRSRRCAETCPVLPELALGIADGEERGRVLAHLAGCPDCRRELEQLSGITDDLVALAPEREPPAGFEARVLERLAAAREPAPVRRPRRLRLRGLGFGGAALAGAAVAAVVLALSFSDDRRLATQYRAALQNANGTFFESAPLRAPDGERAGTVFAYQGSPSWMYYVLNGRYRSGRYREQIVTRNGRTITLPAFRLAGASWGTDTPVPVRDIALVRLVRERHEQLEARLPLIER
jgi:Putative zinc-finger